MFFTTALQEHPCRLETFDVLPPRSPKQRENEMREIIHQISRRSKKFRAARNSGRRMGRRFRIEIDSLRAEYWETV